MSMGSSWQKFSKPIAPERGAFPLDLDHQCSDYAIAFKQCISQYKGDNGKCRIPAKEYLNCRMKSGLMDKDEFRNLGFDNENSK